MIFEFPSAYDTKDIFRVEADNVWEACAKMLDYLGWRVNVSDKDKYDVKRLSLLDDYASFIDLVVSSDESGEIIPSDIVDKAKDLRAKANKLINGETS